MFCCDAIGLATRTQYDNLPVYPVVCEPASHAERDPTTPRHDTDDLGATVYDHDILKRVS
jgi:hypothetical protein